MNLRLKLIVAASSAAVLALAASLQGCNSTDDSAGTASTAGTSGTTATAGASSVAGADTGTAGSAVAGTGGASAGTTSVAGADTSGAGTGGPGTAGTGTAGTDVSGAGTGGTTGGTGGAGSGGVAGSSAGAGGATATTFTVQTSTLGQVLATAAGRTLYLFKSDTASTSAPVSACDSNCQTTWPIYYGTPVSVPDGLAVGDFGSFSNGSAMQSTYMGWPLYTYASDANPGDVIGDESASSGSWLAVKIPFTAPD